MNIKFVWDTKKSVSNLQKHQISFELATRIFADPFALTYQDRIENGEYRWQTIGRVDGCLLVNIQFPSLKRRG